MNQEQIFEKPKTSRSNKIKNVTRTVLATATLMGAGPAVAEAASPQPPHNPNNGGLTGHSTNNESSGGLSGMQVNLPPHHPKKHHAKPKHTSHNAGGLTGESTPTSPQSGGLTGESTPIPQQSGDSGGLTGTSG